MKKREMMKKNLSKKQIREIAAEVVKAYIEQYGAIPVCKPGTAKNIKQPAIRRPGSVYHRGHKATKNGFRSVGYGIGAVAI